MAKRIIKKAEVKAAIHNIAEDFRFSNELGDIPRMFYQADTEGVVRGEAIDAMRDYLETGLQELKEHIQWKSSFLAENPQADEAKVMANLKTIEQEYIVLLDFLG